MKLSKADLAMMLKRNPQLTSDAPRALAPVAKVVVAESIYDSNPRSKNANTKLERVACNEPLETHQAKKSDSGKYRVCCTSFRRRLLDEDNLAEKYHVDACRYSGLLPDDAPDRCQISVSQVKVKTKEEEKTVIVIESL